MLKAQHKRMQMQAMKTSNLLHLLHPLEVKTMLVQDRLDRQAGEGEEQQMQQVQVAVHQSNSQAVSEQTTRHQSLLQIIKLQQSHKLRVASFAGHTLVQHG